MAKHDLTFLHRLKYISGESGSKKLPHKGGEELVALTIQGPRQHYEGELRVYINSNKLLSS